MTLTLLTAQDVHDKLVDIIARHPDAVNPMSAANPSACAYTAVDDPDRHCIVGQFGAEEGFDLPEPPPRREWFQVAPRYNWPLTAQAADYLGQVQSLADNFRGLTAGSQPVPWGQIVLPPVPAEA